MFGKEKLVGTNAADHTRPLQCSFCHKGHGQVKKLIAGPAAFICDECVTVCVDIMTSDDRSELRKDGERLQAEVHAESERLRARAATLRRDAGACTLCGRVAAVEDLLAIGSRGSLCGECANAVEDAIAQGKPTNEGAV